MNSLTRMPQSQIVDPAQQWFWNGSQWVCGCDPDPGCPPPFPPTAPPWFPPPPMQPPWYPGANGSVSFSPTAPPNPIRGALWWDGATLHLFDGAAWVAVGGASGGGNTPPSTTPPANPTPGQQWFNGSTLFVWDGNAWVPVAGTKTTISATAPPSPGPGDLWFDGTQLRIWDGSAWNLVGPGATVGPVPTTTQTLAIVTTVPLAVSSAWTIVPFVSTPTVDTTNGWDPVTKRFIPKKAGYYMFVCRSYFGGGMQNGGHALVKNDNGSWQANAQYTIMINALSVSVVAGEGDYINTTGVVHLNGTTDFVRLWGYSDNGNFYPISSNMPTLEGYLLP